MSCCHQMSKHENNNTELLINLGSKHSLAMKFGQLASNITKEKFLSKIFMKNVNWKLVPGTF